MKRNRLIVLVTLSVLASRAWAADAITIVVNPGRFPSVEAAAKAENDVDWWNSDKMADANACTEAFAATELRHFLARRLARPESDIQFATPGTLPARGDVFLIGSATSNPLIEPLHVAAERPTAAESFQLAASSQNGRTITIIHGADRVGALYGVYAYVERLGVRFYGLGDRDTIVPTSAIQLPADFHAEEKPDYLTRGFFAWEDRGDETFFVWMARNRLNLWSGLGSKEKVSLLKKLGMKLMTGSHDVQSICIDPKTYFAAHPEWYGLQDGKRSPNLPPHGKGDNYCTSNAQATAQFAANLVQQCIDGEWRYADVLNLWMTDFGRWCECDVCRAQGTPTDRVMLLTYAVRRALQEAQTQGRLKRNVLVATLAYHETLSPPTKPLPADFDYANTSVTFFPIERCYVHAFADPACTEINAPLCDDLEGWTVGNGRNYTGSMFVGEYYDISSFKTLPVVFSHMMAVDIPWYFKMGARHFHYMHVPMRLWGAWRWNNHLMARLLWNVHADADQIFNEYISTCFPTAPQMRAVYQELEYASENFKTFKSFVFADGQRYGLHTALADDKLPLFPTKHLQYEGTSGTENSGPGVEDIEAAMVRARRAMDGALLHATDPVERERLAEDDRRLVYGEATIAFYYHLVRTAMFHRQGLKDEAHREIVLTEREAAILKGIVEDVQVSFTHSNAKDGLEATQATDVFERFKKLYDPQNVH